MGVLSSAFLGYAITICCSGRTANAAFASLGDAASTGDEWRRRKDNIEETSAKCMVCVRYPSRYGR